MSNIAILGSGGWGTALAIMCDSIGHKVSLWSPFQEEIDEIKTKGENKFLKGVKVPESIHLTSGISCVKDALLVIIATPSFAVRSTCLLLSGLVQKDTVLVNVTKGLDENSLCRLSEIIESILPGSKVVTISGPSHAEEVARGVPTSVVCASNSRKAAEFVQDALMNSNLRVYTNHDMIGVELGGALKNIIALSTGICEGLGLGDNSKAALITRGIAEIARLGVAMGAKAGTFMGLSGIGDLVVTCTSMHSRNRRFGILIGKGYDTKTALEEIGMTVEGYHATKLAHLLSQKMNVELPIITQAYKVLYEGLSPQKSIQILMERPKKSEPETIYI